MIKLFNQSSAGLSLTKAKSFMHASFLSGRPKWIGSLIAGFVVVGALLLMLNPAAADGDRRDHWRRLHLRVNFINTHSTQADPNVYAVGDQFTWGGTVERFKSPPGQPFGTFGVHFVATAPDWAEILLHGTLNLPDGQISFAGLLLDPRIPAPITGGTGAYLGARGQIDHQTTADGEEFILTFVGN